MVTVISLGGSIIAPEGVDSEFLFQFVSLIRELLAADPARRFILVTGGGGPARAWQNAYRGIAARLSAASLPDKSGPDKSVSDKSALDAGNDAADWIGVMATRLNAQLVKAVLGDYCVEDVVTDPSSVEVSVEAAAGAFAGRVLVAAGWKPGFSSDYDAVLLAGRFGASQVINLSNIAQVYTGDPRKNPEARPIDAISWEDFRALVGDEWVPGKNVPFDPVATRHAAKTGLQVICAAGRDLPNLRNLLTGQPFLGTVIG